MNLKFEHLYIMILGKEKPHYDFNKYLWLLIRKHNGTYKKGSSYYNYATKRFESNRVVLDTYDATDEEKKETNDFINMLKKYKVK